MDISPYRDLFPVTKNDVYLNHAAISPLSTKVLESMENYLSQRCAGAIDLFPEVDQIRAALKKNLASLIGAREENIALISNTSEGFNWLVNGLTWQDGDRIILPHDEFPANIYPFLNLERRGVKIDFVEPVNGQTTVAMIREKLHSRTRLLSMSFVKYYNGRKNDLAATGKLCRENDILFSVDGIQGVGALPLDVHACQIDFLSNGGHKWLMGPQGCGFMYISPQLHTRLEPAFAGWLSVKDSWNFTAHRLEFLDDAARYETGTPNSAGIVGARAATDILLQAGTANTQCHLIDLGKHLIEIMEGRGYRYTGHPEENFRSGIYTFTGSGLQRIFDHLSQNRIHVSLRNNAIRFAPHLYNSHHDIEKVGEILTTFKN